MQTKYHHYSDAELVGFKDRIPADAALVEELFNRLELRIATLSICPHCGHKNYFRCSNCMEKL